MTVTHRDNAEIIGRDELNDIEAILSVANTDVDEVSHIVADNADAIFTWDYSLARPQLRKLYEKAKVGQWNADDRPAVGHRGRLRAGRARGPVGRPGRPQPGHYDGTVVEKWSDAEWIAFGIDQRRWTLSQFLHGEQGALLCTAKITETVPWYDAKLYASTQVVDEARHVEVFARYLEEKCGGGFQVNAHLRMLLDDIINDSRWDMTYLGHAGDGRGPGSRRLRLHAPADRRAVAQAAVALRDERRGPPRGVRRAVVARGLRGDDRRRDEGPPGVRLRGRGAHARPLPVPGGVGAARRQPPRRRSAGAAATRRATSSRRCCSPRSCPTARSSACSIATTAGCATASRR